jgi:hypothetical protein
MAKYESATHLEDGGLIPGPVAEWISNVEMDIGGFQACSVKRFNPGGRMFRILFCNKAMDTLLLDVGVYMNENATITVHGVGSSNLIIALAAVGAG